MQDPRRASTRKPPRARPSAAQGAAPRRRRKPEPAAGALEQIFALLRARTGNDFSLYKRSTIHRRIERRMELHRIDTLAQYAGFLRDNSAELELLFEALLIGVTSFFRDPAEWEKLRCEILPALLADRSESGVLRAWVVGCSTGEEAYSLAITLREALEAMAPARPPGNFRLQILATDLGRHAIAKARRGVYPDHITADVSSERLRRFFVPEDHGYRVRTELRELVVFAPQNLVVDPPFTKLDVVVCRNLLIYFSPEVQKALIPRLHRCLAPGGILFLGSAETAGAPGGLFAPVDGKSRIYRRVDHPAAATTPVELRLAPFGYPAAVRGGRELDLPARPPAQAARPRRRTPDASRVAELEDELRKAREEMRTSQEELTATREALLTLNEALQGASEELTTSRQELQCLDEELQSVNHELRARLDELARSNRDLQELLDITGLAALVLDGELRVRRFTAATTSIIQLTAGDVGQPIAEVASELSYPELAEDAREVLRSRRSSERRAGTRDGRTFAIRIMPRLTHDVLDGVVIAFTDASASRALEVALAEQSRRLQQLAESLPSLVWSAGPDGAFDYLSRQWLDYTGVPAAEQQHGGWLEQVHPQDRERVRDDWRAAVRSGSTCTCEHRLRSAAGAYRWFRTRAVPIRDAAGAIAAWYGTSTDIHDVVHSGSLAEGRLATVLDGMSEGLFELDRELTVLSLNRSAERMIERERHEILGRHLFDALPAVRGSELARKLDEVRRGEASVLAFTATLELARDPQQYDVRISPGRHPDAISIFFARGSTDAQGQEAG